jgi:DNA-binding GntR family transcriptional regulator
VYVQVAEFLRRRIVSGRLGPDERLPSESEIQGQFGVGRHTARSATQLLCKQGWAYTVPHRGSFVTPPDKRGTASPA